MAVEPPPHKRKRHEVTRSIDLHITRTTKVFSYEGDSWDRALDVATDLQLPPEVRNIVRVFADPCRFRVASTNHDWVRECLSHRSATDLAADEKDSVLSVVYCAECGDREVICIRDDAARR